MWAQVKSAPNLMMAEMWKDLFEGEGVPTRVVPEGPESGEATSYRILVPRDKQHVIAEILRKV